MSRVNGTPQDGSHGGAQDGPRDGSPLGSQGGPQDRSPHGAQNGLPGGREDEGPQTRQWNGQSTERSPNGAAEAEPSGAHNEPRNDGRNGTRKETWNGTRKETRNGTRKETRSGTWNGVQPYGPPGTPQRAGDGRPGGRAGGGADPVPAPGAPLPRSHAPLPASLPAPADPAPGLSARPAVFRTGRGRLTRRAAGRGGQYLALLCYLVFLAFPFLWLVSVAFKPPRELAALHPTWVPEAPTLDNFRQAFAQQPLLTAAANSLLTAAVSAVLAIVLATPMAYVLARVRTRLSRAATGWVVISQAFPLVLVIIPLFLILKDLRLVDSRFGLVLVYVVWSLPFALWMLTGYIRAVPRELEEAAAVDGAGRLRTLVSVTAPLLAPGIVATGLFAFITAWNEFFFALVLLKSPEKQTLPVVLTHFLGAEGVADLGPLAAAALLATLPSLLLFTVIQRRITGGMLAGAVKS